MLHTSLVALPTGSTCRTPASAHFLLSQAPSTARNPHSEAVLTVQISQAINVSYLMLAEQELESVREALLADTCKECYYASLLFKIGLHLCAYIYTDTSA